MATIIAEYLQALANLGYSYESVLVQHALCVLEAHVLKKKKASETILREKRRKLILNLREHLVQAQTGVLEGEVLTAWLKELQKEFVNRMTALEAEASSARQESEESQSIHVRCTLPEEGATHRMPVR